MKKYLKPTSLTFWASALPLLLGVAKAIAFVVPHGETVEQIIDNLTGGIDAYILINTGLAGIGLRAAL